MTELSFTKQFLSTLSSRPIRTNADFCEDARKLPARTPYTLPRTAKPKSKKASLASSATSSIPTGTHPHPHYFHSAITPLLTVKANITLRSLRGASITHPLPATPLSTSIITLKHQLSTASKIPIEKIKLLLKGRVLSDLKTLEGVGVKAGEGEVVISVMVMGGGGEKEKEGDEEKEKEGEEEKEEKGGGGEGIVVDEAFWVDLRGWLDGRVGGQLAEEMLGVFRRGWGTK
ncbi:unnamed protein product [Tuber aestivum]|uniref:Ubiquitin-like domain-containing protein n=1 Tax=Tuber aestivum TaxID=59557 RepID=A0A292PUX6_9PEZI|nr:unnamed protein product [Tuber aestivum]